MKYLVDAWSSLSVRGRGVVAVVLIVVLAAILAYSMFLGYDWAAIIQAVR